MRSTPAPVVDVSPVHAQKSTEDGLTRSRGAGGYLFLSPLIFADEEHTHTCHRSFAHTCTEVYRGWPDQDPGAWGVTDHFYPSFLQMRRTPAPVVDVSSTHAQKSTEDGQTTIQGFVC